MFFSLMFGQEKATKTKCNSHYSIIGLYTNLTVASKTQEIIMNRMTVRMVILRMFLCLNKSKNPTWFSLKYTIVIKIIKVYTYFLWGLTIYIYEKKLKD